MTELITLDDITIADAYLNCGDTRETAFNLGISVAELQAVLTRSEVTDYINIVYKEQTATSMNRMSSLMDDIINAKRSDGIYTEKDLADLVALQHKMLMDNRSMALKEQKANQITNTQININTTPQYTTLLSKIE